jgi:isoleucyl-tRNA synthetase
MERHQLTNLVERLRSGLRISTRSRMMRYWHFRTCTSIRLSVRTFSSASASLLRGSLARNRLESFVRSRSEWCISRQRVWGVPIPALYHLPSGKAVLNDQSLTHILSVLEEKGVQHWWDGPVSDFVPAALEEVGEHVMDTWAKGTDTMDVWFDSGSSWSMLQGIEGHEGREHLADVCVEGSDQHRGWFQSQLLTRTGTAVGEEKSNAPYGTLITHGMVLDEKGKKMSKSVGNIVSPIAVIEGGKVRDCLCSVAQPADERKPSCRIERRNRRMAQKCSACGRRPWSIGGIWRLGRRFYRVQRRR